MAVSEGFLSSCRWPAKIDTYGTSIAPDWRFTRPKRCWRLRGRRPSRGHYRLTAVAHFGASHEPSSIGQWQCSRYTSILTSGMPLVDIGQTSWQSSLGGGGVTLAFRSVASHRGQCYGSIIMSILGLRSNHFICGCSGWSAKRHRDVCIAAAVQCQI